MMLAVIMCDHMFCCDHIVYGVGLKFLLESHSFNT
jgi:hypothetical protein